MRTKACHPNLAVFSAPHSGEPHYYEYQAGAVRVSLGDSWEFGDTLRSKGDRIWTFITDATVRAGSAVLVEHGRPKRTTRGKKTVCEPSWNRSYHVDTGAR
jgi:hypothetical protein